MQIVDASTLLTGANCGRKHLTDMIIVDKSTLLTGANCGQKHLTATCELWMQAPYWQVQIVDDSTLPTGASRGHKLFNDRCRLWTQASYWQMQVVDTSILLTGASCGQKLLADRCKLWTRANKSESANRLFRLSRLAHTIDPPPHLPQHRHTHCGNTSVNINKWCLHEVTSSILHAAWNVWFC